MLSPTMTVVVLVVLWLIVVVPMVVRRSDERRRDRSVDGFGRAMRALGRRSDIDADAEVFMPTAARDRAVAAPSTDERHEQQLPTRRPVPVAQEALMYPVDRSDMSAARTRMMTRRRRSLGLLGIGTLVLVPLAVVRGGALILIAAPFVLGLTGYLWFLRSQARRDQDRRHNRMQRALERRSYGVDLTADDPVPTATDHYAESVVRIDDDDIELHSMDTIDLTGLYSEELAAGAGSVNQRRAS